MPVAIINMEFNYFLHAKIIGLINALIKINIQVKLKLKKPTAVKNQVR